jgi:hypothetical protein
MPTTNGNVGYTVLVTLGTSGANPVVYTVTGTYCGQDVTEEITATGEGTYEGIQPFTTITAFASDVDPVGTTDLDTLDIHFQKHVRSVQCGGAGIVSARLREDSSDASWTVIAGQALDIEVDRIRCNLAARAGSIQQTTATLITVAR